MWLLRLLAAGCRVLLLLACCCVVGCSKLAGCFEGCHTLPYIAIHWYCSLCTDRSCTHCTGVSSMTVHCPLLSYSAIIPMYETTHQADTSLIHPRTKYPTPLPHTTTTIVGCRIASIIHQTHPFQSATPCVDRTVRRRYILLACGSLLSVIAYRAAAAAAAATASSSARSVALLFWSSSIPLASFRPPPQPSPCPTRSPSIRRVS